MPKPQSLKNILDQIISDYEGDDEQEPLEYNADELVQEIGKLNELNNRLHECYKGINEAIPSLIKNAKCASHHLMKEIENKDSFTTGIVKENAKELRQLSEKLAGIYEGVREPLLKLASMSEDIGQKLDRYYNIR